MSDLNILNRATFEETTISIDCIVKAGQTEKAWSDANLLSNGQLFCLQEISWRYGVDNIYQDNYGWPRSPLRVTFEGVFRDRAESPFKCSPPKILNNVQLITHNPSNLSVKIYYILKGILVTPRGTEALSFKEVLGYVLLNDNQRGILALSEVMAAKNELPMENIIASLAGGNVSNLQLPASESPKALPMDESSLLSMMIGDLVIYKSEAGDKLKLEMIEHLANYLIKKHWYR